MNPENLGYAIIGTPKGYQAQSRGLLQSRNVDSIVDLPNRMVMVFPNEEILTAIRVVEEDGIHTYFVLYRYAKEIGSERQGTYYGSVIVLKNCKAAAEWIYAVLVELATNLQLYTNPTDGRFLANIDEVDFRIPKSLAYLSNSLEALSSRSQQYNDKPCFIPVQVSSNTKINFIDAVFQNERLQVIKKIYLSEGQEVDKYVREQGGMVVLNDIDLGVQSIMSKHRKDVEIYEQRVKQLIRERDVALRLADDQETKTSELIKELESLKQRSARKKPVVSNNEEGLKPRIMELQQQSISLGNQLKDAQQTIDSLRYQNQVLQNANYSRGMADNRNVFGEEYSEGEGLPWLKRYRWLIMSVSVVLLFGVLALFAIKTKLISSDSWSMLSFVEEGSTFEKEIKHYIEGRKFDQEKHDRFVQELDNGDYENEEKWRQELAFLKPQETNQDVPLPSRNARQDAATSALTDQQKALWVTVESYLNTYERLKYDDQKMVGYKNDLDALEMQNTPQYNKFQEAYKNYLGSGYSKDELKQYSIPVSVLKAAKLEGQLTVDLLVEYLYKHCTFPNVFTIEKLRTVIVNFNKNDVDNGTGEIKGDSPNLIAYIPKSANCL
ncbi:MAG: hypothetical protein IT258_23085 [Saprospiraceae bacterium]|nr:hypothetical protein [Saprospiraceae bacterium]